MPRGSSSCLDEKKFVKTKPVNFFGDFRATEFFLSNFRLLQFFPPPHEFWILGFFQWYFPNFFGEFLGFRIFFWSNFWLLKFFRDEISVLKFFSGGVAPNFLGFSGFRIFLVEFSFYDFFRFGHAPPRNIFIEHNPRDICTHTYPRVHVFSAVASPAFRHC